MKNESDEAEGLLAPPSKNGETRAGRLGSNGSRQKKTRLVWCRWAASSLPQMEETTYGPFHRRLRRPSPSPVANFGVAWEVASHTYHFLP